MTDIRVVVSVTVVSSGGDIGQRGAWCGVQVLRMLSVLSGIDNMPSFSCYCRARGVVRRSVALRWYLSGWGGVGGLRLRVGNLSSRKGGPCARCTGFPFGFPKIPPAVRNTVLALQHP